MGQYQKRPLADPGAVLLEAGHAELAIPYFMELIKKEPQNWQHYSNLGIAYRILNHLDVAESYLLKALSKNSNAAPVWLNLSNVLTDLGRFKDALDCLLAAYKLIPGSQTICLNLSCALLREGKWHEAWPLWELGRYRNSWFEVPEIKLWRGQDLKDKKIVVTMEGGYGDSFLFFRFLPDLQERGGHVSFYVWDQQASLFENHPWAHRIIKESEGIDPQEFDFQVALMSIPARLDLASNAIPSATRYLEGHEEKGIHAVSGGNGKPKIGLCWSAEENGVTKNSRSIKPEQIEILKDCPVHWYSLQLGDCPEWMENTEFKDWKDTATLIEKLDLVISVDTAVCHLSGALGKKTWTIVPRGSDWKWGKSGESTPWYPNMRVLRSRLDDTFTGVLLQIQKELSEAVT